MIKQTIILALCAVALVSCELDDVVPDVGEVVAKGSGSDLKSSLGSHLRDLSRVANNAYQEARPTLDNIHNDINQGLNQLKENPHVRKVSEQVDRVKNNPHVQQAYGQVREQVDRVKNDPRVQQSLEKARPHLERFKTRFSEESARAAAKLRELAASGSGSTKEAEQ